MGSSDQSNAGVVVFSKGLITSVLESIGNFSNTMPFLSGDEEATAVSEDWGEGGLFLEGDVSITVILVVFLFGVFDGG